ncbi:Hypothetical predicted protein [Pelobates cultripes]|uniref:Uncharacterized protein n=1 Tax=Pelobates cultripes TaxID=61616 RepID=A0AAD1RZW3_PELCU|nr:Hypothetical predicted protein [Pelobates cultripes]
MTKMVDDSCNPVPRPKQLTLLEKLDTLCNLSVHTSHKPAGANLAAYNRATCDSWAMLWRSTVTKKEEAGAT